MWNTFFNDLMCLYGIFFYYYFFKKQNILTPNIWMILYILFSLQYLLQHTNAEHVYTATVGTNVFFQVSNSFLHTQVQSLASTC